MKKLFLTLPIFALFLSSCAQEPITPLNQGWRGGVPYRPIGAPSKPKPYVLEGDSMSKGLQRMSAQMQ